jgi:hypothetical protein
MEFIKNEKSLTLCVTTDIYRDLTKTVVGDVSNAIRKNVVVVLI